MEAVAEGLWWLADHHERIGDIPKAIKSLEAICQSHVSFLPIVEVKTRLRIATLLLNHTQNVNHAKSHLERSHLLLKSIPSCFDLKFKAFSLLSQCYHLIGSVSSQIQILNRALEVATTASIPDQVSVKLWSCNFYSQLANALIIEGDYQSSLSALESGSLCATELSFPELEMFFVMSILHVHLMQWEDGNVVERAVQKCDEVWASIGADNRRRCLGLLFYNELLHIFYRLRICDYKNASEHIDRVDNAMKADMQQMQQIEGLTKELDALDQSLSLPSLRSRERLALTEKQAQIREQLRRLTSSVETPYSGQLKKIWGDKLELAPPPINGEWLPRNAVYVLVDLIVVLFGRPKGNFKECSKRIQSGLQTIKVELLKLGITDDGKEANLQHSAIWMASVYLMILMQFLENKVAMDLTRSEFVEAQEALLQMKTWFQRFPTILQSSESIIEMLRGQYAHAVGCYNEATFHYIEAAKLTQSKSMLAMCHIYAAVSYICIGDAESSTQALDLIGPVLQSMDSFVGVREKTCVLFAYGLSLMKQHDLQEARNRLARGLQMTHTTLGNLQLVSQYLTILGSLALALHDTTQAREILRSSLTLAKKLYDVPTQIWVLTVLTALYQELGEKGNEMENAEYQKKKTDDLQKRLADAQSSIHHIELIDKAKIEVRPFHEVYVERVLGGQSMAVNLDIPESVGLSTPLPPPSSRGVDSETRRRSKRRL